MNLRNHQPVKALDRGFAIIEAFKQKDLFAGIEEISDESNQKSKRKKDESLTSAESVQDLEENHEKIQSIREYMESQKP